MARKLALRQIRRRRQPAAQPSADRCAPPVRCGEELAEIAGELELSYRTVANSVSQIKRS